MRDVAIAVVYHSGHGHTKVLAQAVLHGIEAGGARAALFTTDAAIDALEDLAAFDGIVFGSPTYMGSASAHFKRFMEESQSVRGQWRDKLAAGFTNSASQSGDKLNTLVQFSIFAAQHAMLWVSLGLRAGNNSSQRGVGDLNRLGSFLGAMAQSNIDEDSTVAPPQSDRDTAFHLGLRMAGMAHQFKRKPVEEVAVDKVAALPSHDSQALLRNGEGSSWSSRSVRAGVIPTMEEDMKEFSLLTLIQKITGGSVRVIDLTQTLSPDTPVLRLPEQFGQCAPFQMQTVSRYDERGPNWYWNNFSCNEHTGTHFDAPVHWSTGKDLPENAVDTIPARNFIAQACVIDCSAECAQNNDFLLTIDFVRKWETKHGRIPERSWVLMRTDWCKRAMPAAYLNAREDGMHTPGPTADLVQWMIAERQVLGFGVETIGTDAGQAYAFDPPYPCHHFMHGNGRYGLQCLANLDQLPPQGAVLVATPLKIKGGSGSPLRVIALVES